jgi:hypothetical protein
VLEWVIATDFLEVCYGRAGREPQGFGGILDLKRFCIMNSSPRRYCVDGEGQRVLVGLTFQETLEFEALDTIPADRAYTRPEACREEAKDTRKQRWVQLYTKHETAWREWKVSQQNSHQNGIRLDNGMIEPTDR